MSKREPLHGYKRRMRDENEEKEGNEPELSVRKEGEASISPQGVTKSNRQDRLRRRNETNQQENLYDEVLNASGIDLAGMDEEEKEQLAKILLLSKSEAEQSNEMSLECTKSEDAGLRSERLLSETQKQSPAATRKDEETPQQQCDDSSNDSVVCLSPIKPKSKPDNNTQDLREFQETYEGASQSSPQGASMSQIFTQFPSDEEETQPPSQDLFYKTPASGQGESHASEEVPQSKGEIDMSDCQTLPEDMVDGSLPVKLGNHGDSQPMDVQITEFTGSEGSTVLEIKVQSEAESQEQSQDRPSPALIEGVGRKRKAATIPNPDPKQSRLEVEESVEPISFSMGTYLHDALNSKPLKRRYRRQRRSIKEKKFFSPSLSHSECNCYSEVIFQLFDAYRIALREAQYGRLTHIPWGAPVKVGRHMSRTIDLKKRGNDSFYFETFSSEDELEINKAAEVACEVESGNHDNKSDETRMLKSSKNQRAQKDPDYSPIGSDEDDFVSIPKSRPLFRKRRKSIKEVSPEIQEVKDDANWLNTRGDKSAARESVLSRGSRRSTAVRKPQLDFLEENVATEDNETENLGNKRSSTFRGGKRTYSKRGKAALDNLRSNSPIFANDAEVLQLDEEGETDDACCSENANIATENINKPSTSFQTDAPLFRKNVKGTEKQTVCKTFTFKSSESGKVEVSSKLEVVRDEEAFPSTSGVGCLSQMFSQKSSPKFARDLSKLGHRANKCTSLKESLLFSESKSEKSDICSMEEFPDTLVENDSEDIVMETRSKRSTKTSQAATSHNSPLQTDKEKKGTAKDDIDENIEEDVSKKPKKLGRGKKKPTKESKVHYVSDQKNEKNTESTILDCMEEGSKSPVIQTDWEAKNDQVSPDKDNFHISSSVVFSSRRKRQSSMFFESDESFNLGVSPAKAFPVIYESSGNSPSSSGQDEPTISPKFPPARRPSHSLKTAVEGEEMDLLQEVPDEASIYNALIEEDSPLAKEKSSKAEGDLEEKNTAHRSKHRAEINSSENVPEESRSPAVEIDLVTSSQEDNSRAVGEDQSKSGLGEGVACPLCGVTFSVESIEAHASTCEGIPPGDAPGTAKSPEKWRFALGQQEATDDGDEETCYICDGIFKKGQEYQKHVDECLAEARRQQAELEQGSKVRRGGRLTRNRPTTSRELDEEVDGHHGDPDGSHKRRKVEDQRGVIVVKTRSPSPHFTTSESDSESVDSENGETEEPEGKRGVLSTQGSDIDFDSISNSPIKTFRKIGQLDGCLIDFNNQFKKGDKSKSKPRQTKKKQCNTKKRKRPARRKKPAKKLQTT